MNKKSPFVVHLSPGRFLTHPLGANSNYPNDQTYGFVYLRDALAICPPGGKVLRKDGSGKIYESPYKTDKEYLENFRLLVPLR